MCIVTIDVLHHEKRIAINRAPSQTSDDSRGCMKRSDLLLDFLAFYNFRMLFLIFFDAFSMFLASLMC